MSGIINFILISCHETARQTMTCRFSQTAGLQPWRHSAEGEMQSRRLGRYRRQPGKGRNSVRRQLAPCLKGQQLAKAKERHARARPPQRRHQTLPRATCIKRKDRQATITCLTKPERNGKPRSRTICVPWLDWHKRDRKRSREGGGGEEGAKRSAERNAREDTAEHPATPHNPSDHQSAHYSK